MRTFLSTIIGDKKDWKAMEARAHALPRDHRVVYDAMKGYLWRFTTGDGTDIVALLADVLDELEAGAARGRPVREVTGPDVPAFCDARLPAAGPAPWVDRWRARLDRDVAGALAG